jgi:CHAD domain-containing protein
MTTDRTAIRRRLAIRGWTHRPPRGARKAGHASIVAPLAATVAATVAVGVGVVLARSERQRRRTRQLQLERRLGLAPGEPLARGLQRMALAQADLALELLGGADDPADARARPAISGEKAVHETRKALKRLRALLRLLEHQLGHSTFARENAALRDIAAHLSGARDAAVMLATLDRLIQRHPHKLGRRGVLALRRRLLAEHARIEQLALGHPAARAHVLGELHAFRARVAAWRLPARDGIQLIEADLRRLYRQGRRRYRRVAAGKGQRMIAMHQWRKRVKDLRYAAEMLEPRDSRGGHAGRSVAHLRRLARDADQLGELLGEEHDLAVFAGRLREAKRDGQQTWRTGRRTRKQLLALIAKRRRQLRKRALRRGKRLYRDTPKRFTRRIRAAHAPSS